MFDAMMRLLLQEKQPAARAHQPHEREQDEASQWTTNGLADSNDVFLCVDVSDYA
jgi:hypothetical protein